jgi:hypothetical protein
LIEVPASSLLANQFSGDFLLKKFVAVNADCLEISELFCKFVVKGVASLGRQRFVLHQSSPIANSYG